ncbi:IVNS1ABP [Acanthosepion pharaonis]|uniref:IVNS1ABP n=1 Tax=Acanthosepion pharaonis TaxID=158019 RepID=A0A812B9E9_ACAPH|nr:IVNS1ABP [Sepia pharaonis]
MTNTWEVYSSLNTPRRGAGADIINGKIGGNDGMQSLRSTEIYDTENDCWYLGPQLGIERVSVASLGNKLFAVGGFSGKRFLDSLEYFDDTTEEWCCYSSVDDIWQSPAGSTQATNGMCNELVEPRKKIGKKSGAKVFPSSTSDQHNRGIFLNGVGVRKTRV